MSHDIDPDTDSNDDEPEFRQLGAWCICPNCSGDGHHAQHLGSYTMSEFYEAFDDEESRANYFSGAYDTFCQTCQGTGKVRDGDPDVAARYQTERESQRIAETGRNDAGEWVCMPNWYGGH